MKLPLLLCAILLISYADALVGHRYYCPPDFVRLGNGCYLFSSHITSWQNAHFACRDAQAQLAVFETRWEDSTIGTYLSRPEFAPLERWIGGLYDWNGQQWLWGATGEPMKYLGFGDLTSDRLREWHCVYLDPEQSQKWNHKLCTKELHYVCELPLVRVEDIQDTQ